MQDQAQGRLLPTLSLLLLLALSVSAEGALARSGGGKHATKAVVIWDGLPVDKEQGLTPSRTTTETLARATCGDIVLTLGERRRGRIRIQVGEATGWAFEAGVVELSGLHADAQLLAAAHGREEPDDPRQEPDYLAPLALYWRHRELFPRSPYAGYALYRYGQLAERLAVQASREAGRQLSSGERASDTSYAEWEGLCRYQKWGLTFRWSHLGGDYYYGGEAYRKILEDHPHSDWADNAAYQLLKLERTESGGWEGHPTGPLTELAHWRDFIAEHPGSEMRPGALLEMVYLHRVLYEIFSTQQGLVDERKARAYRSATVELAEKVRREFEGTQYAAEAERNVAELELGRHVYLGGVRVMTAASALPPPDGQRQGPPIAAADEYSKTTPEALRPDWGPPRVSSRVASTARMVYRFVAQMSYRSGRAPEAERELLAQRSTRTQEGLRGLLRELPPSDRFRFMVAFTMYWLDFDPRSSCAVLLEYCPPHEKPGYSEDTIDFLDYAYRKRPEPRLLEGILGWVPQADGAGASVLSRILPDKARNHPRDLLAALRNKPPVLWGRTAALLRDRDTASLAQAYPGLVAIADHRSDPLSGLAQRLMREMAATWPTPSEPSSGLVSGSE